MHDVRYRFHSCKSDENKLAIIHFLPPANSSIRLIDVFVLFTVLFLDS